VSTPSNQDIQEVAKEALRWLRYYQDLGFYSIARPAGPSSDSVATTQESHLFVATSASSAAPPDSIVKDLVLPQAKQPAKPVTVPASTTLFAANFPREPLEAVRKDLGDNCQRCKLSASRKSIVFGSGNEKAELVFVGEGPGADEDEQGLPFVGRAGQLLTDMIEKGMKIPRPDVYICNIVKCRPPQNRKPEPDEVAACRQFVERQIMAIRPKAVCALGATAAETLLGVKEPMGRLRGKQYEIGGIPLIVTYHPAFLLRDPSRKADTWADLKMLMAILKM
jgi:uracil-DNA glycosylase family 4